MAQLESHPTMTAGTHPVRTYGGWRRTRGIGLFGSGPIATVVVLGAVLVPMLTASMSIRVALLLLPICAAVVLFTLLRVGGTPVGQVAVRRLTWTIAVARGRTRHRASCLTHHDQAWTLPGPLADTRLLSAPDGRGGTFGLVWNRRTGHLAATLRVAATSTWLVDGADADAWVSNWHSWLASLGYLPMVRSVAVTVDTAPESGTRLHDAVTPQLDPNAPADCLALVRELVHRSPAAAADIDTRITITFDPKAAATKLRDLDAATAEVSRQLTGLESAIGTCGVALLGRASAAQLAATVRAAYDPAARGELHRHLAQPAPADPDPASADAAVEWPQWAVAGPIGAEETWDAYRHDSGASITWGWHEAPRQQVTAGVLARLLSPGRFAKRVTLIYQPLSAGQAARVLEAQVNAAAFRDAYRRTQKRDESARDTADRLQAQRAAAEEAQGAGVVRVSMLVTATVATPELLTEAAADVESRADQSKINLRRLYGDQAFGFAATLPV